MWTYSTYTHRITCQFVLPGGQEGRRLYVSSWRGNSNLGNDLRWWWGGGKSLRSHHTPLCYLSWVDQFGRVHFNSKVCTFVIVAPWRWETSFLMHERALNEMETDAEQTQDRRWKSWTKRLEFRRQEVTITIETSLACPTWLILVLLPLKSVKR